jgi:hypothetical protein
VGNEERRSFDRPVRQGNPEERQVDPLRLRALFEARAGNGAVTQDRCEGTGPVFGRGPFEAEGRGRGLAQAEEAAKWHGKSVTAVDRRP